MAARPKRVRSSSFVQGFNIDTFYLHQHGRIVDRSLPRLQHATSNVHVSLRLCGGKGGFGSMLRAIGAQIEKTTNREACRDLSGRRLRDINEEKRLKSWLDGQAARDEEKAERRRQKLARAQAVPKHVFEDREYEASRPEMTQSVADAVEEGMRAAATAAAAAAAESSAAAAEKAAAAASAVVVAEAGGSGVKRKSTVAATKKVAVQKKKKKRNAGALWLGADLSSGSEDSSDDDDSGEKTATPNKVAVTA